MWEGKSGWKIQIKFEKWFHVKDAKGAYTEDHSVQWGSEMLGGKDFTCVKSWEEQ